MVEIVLCSKLSYALTWCLLLTAEQLSHYYPLEWYIDQTPSIACLVLECLGQICRKAYLNTIEQLHRRKHQNSIVV
jgi:hypothetical protein